MQAQTTLLHNMRTIGMIAAIAVFSWFSSPQSLVPAAAWLGPVVIVRFMRDRRPVQGLIIFWSVTTAVGAFANLGFVPLPLIGHLIFTPVISLFAALPFLIDRLLAPRVRGFAATLVLPLAYTTLDYAQSFFFSGTIISPAYTQAANLPLIQIASITGVWGITFLLFWFGSVMNWLWERRQAEGSWQNVRSGTAVYAVSMGAVLLFGSARLLLAPTAEQTVKVAGISVSNLSVMTAAYTAMYGQQVTLPRDIAPSDAQLVRAQLALDAYFAEPNEPKFAAVHTALEQLHNELLNLTRREARAGAKVITWSEANAFVLKPDEAALLGRAQQLARDEGIYLYVPLATFVPGIAPFTSGTKTMENKIVAIGPDGALLSTYSKTKLPVGDTSIPGDGHIPVQRTGYGTIAAVICYDMDTPDYIRQAGLAAVDVILVPSGDWQAITPWHPQIAKLRAVENGFSMVRPVSSGLMLASDQYGRTLATLDYFSTKQPVLVASVPIDHIPTLYARIGDSFAWLCVAVLGVTITWTIVKHLPRLTPARRQIHHT